MNETLGKTKKPYELSNYYRLTTPIPCQTKSYLVKVEFDDGRVMDYYCDNVVSNATELNLYVKHYIAMTIPFTHVMYYVVDAIMPEDWTGKVEKEEDKKE